MFGVVEAKVIERRGKEVAEAVPILVLAVRSLERSVAEATEPAIVENREAILGDARRFTGSFATTHLSDGYGSRRVRFTTDPLAGQLKGRKGWRQRTSAVVEKLPFPACVRSLLACVKLGRREEALTQTESQEPAGRGKEEGSASDGQVEDDEETEDNEYWAMTKAIDALRPEKIVVHLTALAVPGRLACNMLTTDTCVPLGKERPFFGHMCARCLSARKDMKSAESRHERGTRNLEVSHPAKRSLQWMFENPKTDKGTVSR